MELESLWKINKKLMEEIGYYKVQREKLKSKTECLVFTSKAMLTNTYQDTQDGLRSNDRNKKNIKMKNKMLLLSDSHGRGINNLLRNSAINEHYEIESIIKPNATFKNITKNIVGLTNNYGPQDVIVIMAGTNDISNDHKSINPKATDINYILKRSLVTNVMLLTIPYRYDDATLNKNILRINRKLPYILYYYTYYLIIAH